MAGHVNAYLATSIAGMNRGTLLLAMYEGSLGFLRQAVAAHARGDLRGFAHFLRRGQDIIAELLATIDRAPAPRLAENLERLYDFMLFQLTEANCTREAMPVQHVIELLARTYEAFRRVIRQPTPEVETILHASPPMK
jgi:flagellar protein FliS